MTQNDTEHRVIKTSAVLQRELIEIEGQGLVSKHRQVVKESNIEYECACGGAFENASRAYDHLNEVRSIDTDT